MNIENIINLYDEESEMETDDEGHNISIKCNENDYIDIENEAYEWIEEYLETEIIKMSSPNFHTQMLVDITYIFYEYWYNCNLCEEADYDDVEELMELLISNYFELNNIPMRSYQYISTVDIPEKNISLLKEQIDTLKNIPQPKQRTKEWYIFRYNLITASNLWKALGSKCQQNSLICEKCKPLEIPLIADGGYCNTESPMHWGVKYEPVSVMMYEYKYQTRIDDFGCIPHRKYDCIGASPDGINVDVSNPQLFGRMLEIKNIYNREITGIPKEEYWIQTQIQMETCDLDECDFVETRFKEYESEELFYNDDVQREHKGVFLYFVQSTKGYGQGMPEPTTPYNNSPFYKYMPLDYPIEKENIDLWVLETKEEFKNELTLFKTIYWYLDEFSCVLIQRNKQWFDAALVQIHDVWQTILQERITGYQHRAAKKRVKMNEITVEGSNSTSTSQTIKNMPMNYPVCIIKLDTDMPSTG